MLATNQHHTVQATSEALTSPSQCPLQVELVQMLSAVVWWVTLVATAAVSSIAGVSALLSLARCYQKSARLPTTKCSECTTHPLPCFAAGPACDVPMAGTWLL